MDAQKNEQNEKHRERLKECDAENNVHCKNRTRTNCRKQDAQEAKNKMKIK